MIGNFIFFFLNYVYGHCQFWEILFLKEIILPKASMTLIPPPRGSNVLALSVYTKKTMPFPMEQKKFWKLVPIIINKRHWMVHLGGIQSQRVHDQTIPTTAPVLETQVPYQQGDFNSNVTFQHNRVNPKL